MTNDQTVESVAIPRIISKLPNGKDIWSSLQRKAPDCEGQNWAPKPTPKFGGLGEKEAKEKYCLNQGRLDVLLLVANPVEFVAVVNTFCVLPESKRNPDVEINALQLDKAYIHLCTVHFGRVPVQSNENQLLQVGVVQTTMGPEGMHIVGPVINTLRPRAVISVGVGWGNPKLLARDPKPAFFGDVMVSSMLVEFSNNAKLVGNDFEKLTTVISRNPMPAPGALLQARFSSIGMDGQWAFKRPDNSDCNVLMGKMATGGFLLNDANFVTSLIESAGFTDIVGGEMEGWGLYSATVTALAEGSATQWIIVKGICDWGMVKSDGWQPFAAAAATNLVLEVLTSADALSMLKDPGYNAGYDAGYAAGMLAAQKEGLGSLPSYKITKRTTFTGFEAEAEHVHGQIPLDLPLLEQLHMAVKDGNYEDVRKLLKAAHKAKIDPAEVLVGGHGRTVLHKVAFAGHFDVARILCDYLDKNILDCQDDDGETPLFVAVDNNEPEMARFFLKMGANVNIADAGKRTPLHCATNDGCVEIVELLLEYKADRGALDRDGKTPLELAKLRRNLAFGIGNVEKQFESIVSIFSKCVPSPT